MDKTVRLSEQMHHQLEEIRKRNGYKSFDSVIRHLVTFEADICKGRKCTWYWNCLKYGCQMFKAKEVSSVAPGGNICTKEMEREG